MKTIYEERADDLRILAGKEPDFAAGIHSPHNACQFRTDCRQAEAEIARLREDAERYRWLRDDKRGRMLSVVLALEWTGNPELSDAAVDAARKS